MVISSKFLNALPNNQLTLADYSVGDSVFIDIDNIPTEFVIVNQGNPDTNIYDGSCDGTWLMMKDLYIKDQWNNDLDNTYSSSSIHRYLNEQFLNKISKDIQEVVLLVKIPYIQGKGYGGKLQQGDKGLYAKIFILSGTEIGWNINNSENIFLDGAVLDYFKDLEVYDEKRLATLNGEVIDWWLRTPDKNSEFSANRVLSSNENNESNASTFSLRDRRNEEEVVDVNNNDIELNLDEDNIDINESIEHNTEESLPMMMSLNRQARDWPDIAEDYIIIDDEIYIISNVLDSDVTKDISQLISADLALLEWNAKGNSVEDVESFDRIAGKFGEAFVSGYWDVYDKVYDLLLNNATLTFRQGFHTSSSYKNITTDTIYKLTRATEADDILVTVAESRKVSGRLVIVADDSINHTATLIFPSAKNFNIQSGGSLAVHGRNKNQRIIMTSQDAKVLRDKVSVVDVTEGSLYLNCVDITDFHFTSSTGYATINFPKGDTERHLYMANASLSNVSTKTETGGILCRAFEDNIENSEQLEARKTTLFIYNSTFTNCVTNASSSSNTTYAGGPAIRSYAADRSKLQVKECIFTDNRINTPASDKTIGGGAIYWKSALAEAALISCTFTDNHSNGVGGAVFNTGKMMIQGCTFTNNSAKSGGAIAVEPPNTSLAYPIPINELSGSLTLDDKTTITDNSAIENGGGIYFNAVTKKIGSKNIITNFDMRLALNGTVITGNEAANGGGIAMHLNYDSNTYTNKITINDKTQIANNTAINNGGSIWMNSESTCDCKNSEGILMLGGTLQNNSAITGGAIYIHKGTNTQNNINFQLEGGNVLGNTATSNGGVAYIDGGNFIMTGGVLGNKNALNTAINGGGVYINGGSATVGGTSIIAGNKATSDGGAAYIQGGNFIMTGGSLGQEGNPNTATNGAGVYVNNGSVSVTGGYVQKNVATEEGGAIYVTGGNTIIGIEDCEEGHAHPEIKDNFAYAGGGIYVTGGIVKFLCGKIISNFSTTAIKGDNVSIVGGAFEYNGGQIGDEGGLGIIINGGSMSDNRPNGAGLDDSYYCTRKYGIRPVIILNKNTIISMLNNIATI